ncbi:hypothetical protein BU16DRAFT_561310 [Lophium mytilinum]|uniref:Uncharacterized protein n=1 Tax=Lophium mytilinum TaxID=390894 RepID=A0A6A6QVS2_9PEZI|nr:hypothetical protein BU16DRAFT_561310 [Lophium mytilinum]
MADISAFFSCLALSRGADPRHSYIPNGWKLWENATHLTTDDLSKLGFYLGHKHILERVIASQPDNSIDRSLIAVFDSMSIRDRAHPRTRALNFTVSNVKIAMIEYFKALLQPENQADTQDSREMYEEYQSFLSQDPDLALIETYHLRRVLKRFLSRHIDVDTLDSDEVWSRIEVVLCQIDVTASLYRRGTEYELDERAEAYDSGYIDGQLDTLLEFLSDDPYSVRLGISQMWQGRDVDG